MKKLIINQLFFFFFLLTLFSVSLQNVKAEAGNNKETSSFQDRYREADSFVNNPEKQEIESRISYRIYSNDFDLVYETKDKDDRKLEGLMPKCDLISESNNTHIYQLSR